MSKKRILIIDDEVSFTKLVKVVMQQYEIREENDATRALSTARDFKPDLILLDVVMPEMDGGDVAVQIRADPLLKRVPIVFLTAVVSGSEVTSQKQIGGFPFVAKPVDPARLAVVIEENLE